MIGIGAMLHALSGGSEHAASEYVGREIEAATIHDERLVLVFTDGTVIHIWDNGQSCCESRYMSMDDDLSSVIGGRLVNIEAKDGPTVEDYGGEHETCFVEIATDKGFITITNHNEHNGYYGGFGLTITEGPPSVSAGRDTRPD